MMTTVKLFLLASLALSSVGCASKLGDLGRTQHDELADIRVSLAALRSQDAAKPFAGDVERAATYAGQAEAKLATGDAGAADIGLLIDLARGQLLLVKSMMSRATAERALGELSAEYAGIRESLEGLDARQRAADEELGVEP